MPSSFPTSRDVLQNPSAADQKNSATVPHASQHANANDAIEAIEAALPITSEGSVPRGVLPSGYAAVTAGQTGIGTSDTDLTGLSVTVTVGSGRRIRITGAVASRTGTADQSHQLSIKEGTTTHQIRVDVNPVGGTQLTLHVEVYLTPSAGSHTYKLALKISGGTSPEMVAGATQPAFIVVEDVGV